MALLAASLNPTSFSVSVSLVVCGVLPSPWPLSSSVVDDDSGGGKRPTIICCSIASMRCGVSGSVWRASASNTGFNCVVTGSKVGSMPSPALVVQLLYSSVRYFSPYTVVIQGFSSTTNRQYCCCCSLVSSWARTISSYRTPATTSRVADTTSRKV
uniref:Putative secreted protein n=1 Tax=Anopheles marajoara TaxID=58244 RepID=A0A2M4C6D5_9DIPT